VINTYFVDLHGTLVEHQGPEEYGEPMVPLPGRAEWSCRMHRAGHKIILVTGMPATYEGFIQCELQRLGIVVHDILAGLSSGPRWIINDKKPYDPHEPMAIAWNLDRDGKEWPI